MAADILHTVFNAMVACGINNDIFDDTLATGMDITFEELDEHFKTYSELSLAQGQIHIPPGTRKNM